MGEKIDTINIINKELIKKLLNSDNSYKNKKRFRWRCYPWEYILIIFSVGSAIVYTSFKFEEKYETLFSELNLLNQIKEGSYAINLSLSYESFITPFTGKAPIISYQVNDMEEGVNNQQTITIEPASQEANNAVKLKPAPVEPVEYLVSLGEVIVAGISPISDSISLADRGAGNSSTNNFNGGGAGSSGIQESANTSTSEANDAPAISNLNNDSLSYTEGDSAVVIDQDVAASVSDADSNDFASGTLSVSFTAGSTASEDVLAIFNEGTGAGQISVNSGDVAYESLTIGTFSGGIDGTDLLITFNSNADVAAVSALLNNITYENINIDNPSAISRTVSVVLTDGDGGTSTINEIIITVIPVNDAPILDLDTDNSSGALNNDFATSFTEGTGPIALADVTDTLLADVDNSQLASLTVTLINLLDVGVEFLDANVGGTSIAKSYDGVTGILTLSGVDTVANYQQVLRTVTYDNTSDNPTQTDRTVTFIANDGAANSATATATVDMSSANVNDAPALDLDADDSSGALNNDFATSFIEGTGPIALSDVTDALLTDVDDSQLASLTVTLTNLLDAGAEFLDANVGGTSIAKSYDGVTGILTLSGVDTVANYQQVLRTVTYDNTSDNPTQTDRTVTFIANDGAANSATATATVDMSSANVNDAPALDLDADNSSGALNNDFATSFTEGSGPIALADVTDALLTDVDDSQLVSLTVTLTNLLDVGVEFLDANVGGTSIAKSYDGVTGILTLSGVDTVANYQQVLRTVTYDNTSDNPTQTERTVTFIANDGAVNSATATATVDMSGVNVNDAPALDLDADNSSGALNNDFATSFTEGSGPIALADVTDALLTDVDDSQLASLTVTLTNLLDAGVEFLDANVGGTSIVKSYDGVTGILTLSGVDTVANYQQVLRTVTYDNTSDNPTQTDRTVTFIANDGAANSATATATVDMSGVNVNDAPALDLDADNSSGALNNDFATSFTEGSGPIALADVTDALLTDVDDSQLASLTVTLTNLLDVGVEFLDANVGGTSIVKSYDGVTGILTLSGVDTVANYQQVLRTVTYDNTSDNPTQTDRTVTFIANDGAANSATATATVDMSSANVNDAPALDLDADDSSGALNNDFATSFTEGSGPIALADVTDALLTDVDDSQLVSLTVTLTNLLDVGVEFLDANVGGTSIAKSYDGVTGILTLSGVDTVANYQQVLRTVTYDNTSDNPTQTDRTVTFIANDGAANSATATATVDMSIANVNDAPALDLDADDSSGALNNDFATSFTEGSGPIALADVTDALLTDVDNSQLVSLTVTLTNLLDAGVELLDANVGGTSIVKSYDGVTGILTLSGVDTVANYQQVLRTVTYDNTSDNPTQTDRTVTFIANDGAANSATATATVDMSGVNVNDAPALDLDADNSSGALNNDFATSFTEGSGPIALADVTDALLTDVDDSQLVSLTVTLTNLLDAGVEFLDANVGGTSIVKSYDGVTGILTLSGVDTVANYQQVLRTVTYDNTSDNPTQTDRTVTFIANDGAANSATATATVDMSGVNVNDAPALDLDADNSSGALNNDFATSFTEGSGPIALADVTDALLTDVDDSQLASLTVTLTNLLDVGVEFLDANVGGTSIVKSYDGVTGILTLSGVDTVANYQQVLRTVTYDNTSDNPTQTDRTVTFIANDGAANSATATATVDMSSANVNDAPALDLDADNSSGALNNDFATSFTEGSGPIALADVTDALLTDVDDSQLASLTVTLTNLLDVGVEFWDANVGGTSIVKSYDGVTGILTLSGVDTVANYQQVLRTVTYDNTSDNPTQTDRTVTFIANDGAANSATATATVDMSSANVNDAPALDLDADDSSGALNNDFATSFTEGSGPIALADVTDALLTDVDDSQLVSLTVTLTNLLDVGVEFLDANVGGTSIVKSYDGVTGILTLSGVDTVANYQQVLRTVTYDNTSDNPTQTDRTVTFIANDGAANSATATATVDMSSANVNDAPALDLDADNSSGALNNDFATSFTEGLGPIALADVTDALLTDVDDSQLASLTVTLTNLLDAGAEFLDANVGGTSIVKSYDGVTGILTLSGVDTVANYQQVLRTVTYDNTSDNPTQTDRTVTFIANDGAANSATATATVDMSSANVNDAPALDLDADNSSGALNNDFATSFTEGSGPIALADVTDALLTDVDDSQLASLTVTLTNLLDAGVEFLDANVGGTSIAKSYDGVTGILTLSGVDTVANYQQVLRTVTYDNTSDNPTQTDRTVTFIANDGAANSATATATVDMSSANVNDAPALDLDADDSSGALNNDFATSFTEGSGPIALADVTDALLTDVDDSQLVSLTVTLTNLLDVGVEFLDANVGGTSIVKSYDGVTGILTLSGVDTVANYQQVLRTVTYDNTSDNPTQTDRTVTFIANDGAANSATATATVDMSSANVNDAPALDLDADNSSGALNNDFATSFTEGLGPIVLADVTDALLTDVDDSQLASLTVTLTNLLDAGAEFLDANVGGTSIVKSYDGVTGILTLSGVDTVANYQQVLRTVTYDNTSDNPTQTDRTVTFIANDGAANSATATATVDMSSANVNDAPALDLDADNSSGALNNDFATSFTEGSGPIALADVTDALLTDVDDSQLASLTVTLTNLLDAGVEFLDANVGGTSIAKSYDGVTGILTLSGVDTVANYQQVLRTVTYDNTSDNPTQTDRTVTFIANDGAANSATATATVDMSSANVNDAPALDLDADNSSGALNNDFATSFTEGSGPIALADVTDALLTDVDDSQLASLMVTLTNLLDAGVEFLDANVGGTSIVKSYDGVTGILTLSGVDTVANYQQVLRTVTYDNTSDNPTQTDRTVTFIANDGAANSATATATVDMSSANVNDAPALDLDADDSSGASNNDFATSFTEGSGPIALADATDALLTDVDDSQLVSLTVTLTNLLDVGVEFLDANVGGTSIAKSYDGVTGILTLSGVDTVANYQQVLRTVTYDNTSDNPTQTDRTVTFIANDGAANSATATATVDMSSANVNDAPALDLDADDSSGALNNDFTVNFTAGNSDVVIAGPDVIITDLDDTNIESATITLTNPLDGVDESISLLGGAGALPAGISLDGASTTTNIVLTGSATLANYQSALALLVYNNSSVNPTETNRTVNFIINDGDNNSNTAVSTVDINLPPSIANLDGDSQLYAALGVVAAIDQDTAAIVTDTDSIDFNGGTLTVSISANGDAAEDVLAIQNQGTGIGQIGVSGNVVTYENNTIGTIDAINNGSNGNDLVITFNSANATAAAVSVLVQAITYQNTDTVDPTLAIRTVDFTVSDGDGATSATVSASINVNPIVTEPLLNAAELNAFSAAVNTPSNLSSLAFTETSQVFNTAQILVAVTPGSGTLTFSSAITATHVTNSVAGGSFVHLQGNQTELEDALSQLVFTPTNNLGEPVTLTTRVTGYEDGTTDTLNSNLYYFADNGHFYDVVLGVTELDASQARSFAAAESAGGLNGYLVTITSAAEQSFIDTIVPFGTQDYWMSGATRRNVEEWHWDTGPESEVNGGTGIEFWVSDFNRTIGNAYQNWGNGQPSSNVGDLESIEYRPDSDDWNDFDGINDTNRGYIVEYGDLSTDRDSQDNIINVGPYLNTAGVALPAITEGSTNNSISGIQVNGSANNVQVFLAVGNGTLALGTFAGLTAVGNSNAGFNDGFLHFSGSLSAVNTALATLQYTPGATFAGTVDLISRLTGFDDGSVNTIDNNVYYNENNGHFYSFDSNFQGNWNSANTTAEASSLGGLNGYLLNVTESSENGFVLDTIDIRNASDGVWMGGRVGAFNVNNNPVSSTDWYWITGPEGENGGSYFWDTSIDKAPGNAYTNWGVDVDQGSNDYAVFGTGNSGWSSESSGSLNNLVVEYGGLSDDEPSSTNTLQVGLYLNTASITMPIIEAGQETAINGIQVLGTTAQNIQVFLAVDSGTLKLNNFTGLTAITNSPGTFDGSFLHFRGSQADVNAALATLTYTGTAGLEFTLTSRLMAVGGDIKTDLFYNEDNGHFYEFANGPINNVTNSEAISNAAAASIGGLGGYLVTITSATEQSFLNNAFGTGTDYHLGASDSGISLQWYWVTGPEGEVNGGTGAYFFLEDHVGSTNAPQGIEIANAYSNWANNQPSGEDSIAFVRSGNWHGGISNEDAFYIIEYGDLSTDEASQDIMFNVGFLPPIVFDLAGDGIEFVSLADSQTQFDVDQDGELETMAWVNPQDAILAYDKDGDQWITDIDEISFSSYQAGAYTDLQGLTVFDTDQNGWLDSNDAKWDKFNLWQDHDSDGISDAGELISLEAMGVAAIQLSYDAAAYSSQDAYVFGHGGYLKDDGSYGTFADTALRFANDDKTNYHSLQSDGEFDFTTNDAVTTDHHNHQEYLDAELDMLAAGHEEDERVEIELSVITQDIEVIASSVSSDDDAVVA